MNGLFKQILLVSYSVPQSAAADVLIGWWEPLGIPEPIGCIPDSLGGMPEWWGPSDPWGPLWPFIPLGCGPLCWDSTKPWGPLWPGCPEPWGPMLLGCPLPWGPEWTPLGWGWSLPLGGWPLPLGGWPLPSGCPLWWGPWWWLLGLSTRFLALIWPKRAAKLQLSNEARTRRTKIF